MLKFAQLRPIAYSFTYLSNSFPYNKFHDYHKQTAQLRIPSSGILKFPNKIVPNLYLLCILLIISLNIRDFAQIGPPRNCVLLRGQNEVHCIHEVYKYIKHINILVLLIHILYYTHIIHTYITILHILWYYYIISLGRGNAGTSPSPKSEILQQKSGVILQRSILSERCQKSKKYLVKNSAVIM